MKYKICLLLLIVALLLNGCAFPKEVKRETENVVGVIVSTSYTPARLIPMHCGKVTTFITQPAKHYVTVEYNNIKEVFNNSSAYHTYEPGDSIELTFTTVYYDDDSVRYYINMRD